MYLFSVYTFFLVFVFENKWNSPVHTLSVCEDWIVLFVLFGSFFSNHSSRNCQPQRWIRWQSFLCGDRCDSDINKEDRKQWQYSKYLTIGMAWAWSIRNSALEPHAFTLMQDEFFSWWIMGKFRGSQERAGHSVGAIIIFYHLAWSSSIFWVLMAAITLYSNVEYKPDIRYAEV